MWITELFVALLLAAVPAQEAVEPAPPERLVPGVERLKLLRKFWGSKAVEALDSGLTFLVEHQDADGSWNPKAFEYKDGGESSSVIGQEAYRVGLTGLVLLALLHDGNTPDAGPHRDAVRQGLDWLREQQRKSGPGRGLIGEPQRHDWIYNHAAATQALAMANALGADGYRDSVVLAVQLIEAARNPHGAWRYNVPPNGDNDTSVTTWMCKALWFARQGGVEVSPKAFQGGLLWISDARDTEMARIGYNDLAQPSSRIKGQHDTFPSELVETMTAAGTMILLRLGEEGPRGEQFGKATDLMLATPPSEEVAARDYQYWLYGTQVMQEARAGKARKWSRKLINILAKLQEGRKSGSLEGSWPPDSVWSSSGGRLYTTAMACWILACPLEAALPLGQGRDR